MSESASESRGFPPATYASLVSRLSEHHEERREHHAQSERFHKEKPEHLVAIRTNHVVARANHVELPKNHEEKSAEYVALYAERLEVAAWVPRLSEPGVQGDPPG